MVELFPYSAGDVCAVVRGMLKGLVCLHEQNIVFKFRKVRNTQEGVPQHVQLWHACVAERRSNYVTSEQLNQIVFARRGCVHSVKLGLVLPERVQWADEVGSGIHCAGTLYSGLHEYKRVTWTCPTAFVCCCCRYEL